MKSKKMWVGFVSRLLFYIVRPVGELKFSLKTVPLKIDLYTHSTIGVVKINDSKNVQCVHLV